MADEAPKSKHAVASKTNQGILVAVAGGMLDKFGVGSDQSIDQPMDEMSTVTLIMMILGGVWALYGRVKAGGIKL